MQKNEGCKMVYAKKGVAQNPNFFIDGNSLESFHGARWSEQV
jgi:hypothetical protein